MSCSPQLMSSSSSSFIPMLASSSVCGVSASILGQAWRWRGASADAAQDDLTNDDLTHALRDLSDVDRLLSHHALRNGFWPDLLQRAEDLNLQRPLYYGLWSVSQMLGTAVPADVLKAAACQAPAWPVCCLMHALFRRGLRTAHPMAELPMTDPALLALYVRAHWLRMPPLLLARHLARKSWRRIRRTPAVVP